MFGMLGIRQGRIVQLNEVECSRNKNDDDGDDDDDDDDDDKDDDKKNTNYTLHQLYFLKVVSTLLFLFTCLFSNLIQICV